MKQQFLFNKSQFEVVKAEFHLHSEKTTVIQHILHEMCTHCIANMFKLFLSYFRYFKLGK